MSIFDLFGKKPSMDDLVESRKDRAYSNFSKSNSPSQAQQYEQARQFAKSEKQRKFIEQQRKKGLWAQGQTAQILRNKYQNSFLYSNQRAAPTATFNPNGVSLGNTGNAISRPSSFQGDLRSDGPGYPFCYDSELEFYAKNPDHENFKFSGRLGGQGRLMMLPDGRIIRR